MRRHTVGLTRSGTVLHGVTDIGDFSACRPHYPLHWNMPDDAWYDTPRCKRCFPGFVYPTREEVEREMLAAQHAAMDQMGDPRV